MTISTGWPPVIDDGSCYISRKALLGYSDVVRRDSTPQCHINSYVHVGQLAGIAASFFEGSGNQKGCAAHSCPAHCRALRDKGDPCCYVHVIIVLAILGKWEQQGGSGWVRNQAQNVEMMISWQCSLWGMYLHVDAGVVLTTFIHSTTPYDALGGTAQTDGEQAACLIALPVGGQCWGLQCKRLVLVVVGTSLCPCLPLQGFPLVVSSGQVRCGGAEKRHGEWKV